MILTRQHIQFWREQKAGIPSWAPQEIKNTFVPVDVHDLINSQIVPKPKFQSEPGNLINILKMVRRHGKLKETLFRIALIPGTVQEPERRSNYAQKWYKRLVDPKGIL